MRGNIITAYDEHILDMAETLVHESSHQHFYLIHRIARLASEQGMNMSRISPINGKNRNMARILTAYHAVANMMVLHRAVIDAGHDLAADAQARFDFWKTIGRGYIDMLREGDEAFTPDGLAFWKPSVAEFSALCA